MRLKNRTDCFLADRFIREEVRDYQTAGLIGWLKYSRDRHSSLYCYFRERDLRIVAAVDPAIGLPGLLRFPIQTDTHWDGQSQWRYDEERADSLDEILVWVFFHELHHFLCHTRQTHGNWQTRANALGFMMLRKFRAGQAVPSANPAPLQGMALKFREQIAPARKAERQEQVPDLPCYSPRDPHPPALAAETR